MSEIWRENIQAFLRQSNFRVGIFYFASPCIYNGSPTECRIWSIERRHFQ